MDARHGLLIEIARRDSFFSLVEEYDLHSGGEDKAAWLSSKLGMQLPPSADRYSSVLR